MPMPTPRSDEDHDDFIDRCMADDVMTDDFPDPKQRRAVCEDEWDDAQENEVRQLMDNDEFIIEGEDGTEMTLSLHVLRTAVGYYELEDRLNASEARFANALEQLLGYVNNIDERMQALSGEPTVTRSLTPHVDANGYLRFDAENPAVPERVVSSLMESLGTRRPPAPKNVPMLAGTKPSE